MAYQSFLDAGGSTSYRKVTGAGTTGDPAVCHQIIDSGTCAVTQSGTWNITNVSGTISLPTGAATAANQTTIIWHVDGIETTLTSIDGKITACNTGAVVLAAGTAAIGKLAANTGVTIGAVEIAASQTLATVTNLSQMGGAAIAMGTGVRSAGTQRVTIATDDVVPVTGTFWQATQPVSLASVPSHAVTNAGTFAVQIDGAALTSLQLLDDAVSGTGFNISQMNGVAVTMGNGASGTGVQRVTIANDSTGILAGVTTVTTLTTLTGGGVAHDSADSGNPHKIGAKAVASISGVTLVTAADRTDLYAGLDGVQITRPHCNLEDIVSGNATNTDGTSTQCIAAGGAGIKHYITSVVLCNTSATNITVDIKDGSTVKVSIPVPANSGAIFNPPVPIPGSAATAWNFDPSAAATTVTCSMIGFKSKI